MPDSPGMSGCHAGTGQRDRLVEPLAAGQALVIETAEGLAGADKMIDLVNVVDVDRANVEHAHLILGPWQAMTTDETGEAAR